MSAVPTPSPRALAYAQAPRFRRRRILRRLAAVVMGVGLVAGGVKAAGPVAARARLLFWQDRCLSYAPPADFVVYEEGPGAAALLATGKYLPFAAPLSDTPAAGYMPECLVRFMSETGRGAPPRGRCVPLYVQARSAQQRETRLVTVVYWPDDCAGFSPSVNLYGSAVPPTTPFSRAHGPSLTGASCGSYARGNRPRSLRVFAGQPDPADPSRFSIRYVMDGTSGTLYGRVRPDGRHYDISYRPFGPGRE